MLVWGICATQRMLCHCRCSNILGFGAAAIAMGIFLRSLDTLLFNNEDRRVARAEQERMKLAVVEVNHNATSG